MRKVVSSLLILASTVIFTSCETDIDANAEYQDITVVYSLLNPDDTSHYVKINKAFLTDGDANDAASNSDNYTYAEGEITVKIDEYNSSGIFVKSYALARTTNDLPKDDGIFDSNTNVLYKFNEAGLNEENEFRLSITNSGLNKEVTANTKIPQGANMNHFNSLSFINSSDNYLTTTFTVTPKNNVGRISADLIFRYVDVCGDSTDKEIVIPMGEQIATNLDNNALEFSLEGSKFFDYITSNVEPSNTICRRVNNCEVRLTYAGIDYNTYLLVNSPSNNSEVDYTNVTNGLGLFSSLRYETKKSIGFNEDPSHMSYDGQINIEATTEQKLLSLGLGFCSGRSGGVNPPNPYCW